MAFIYEPKVCNPIVGLLALGRPSNIARLVISVIVDSIEATIFWAFTHIRKEILKLSPPITNRNASFFVVLIRWAAWVCTTSEHILPRAVCGSSAALGSASVPVSAFVADSLSHNQHNTTTVGK